MELGVASGIVELSDYNPKWGEDAIDTIGKLWNIFESTAKDIQHIGSTAIKNIKAKPIIDIAVAVDDFSEFESLIPSLEHNGFSYRGWFIFERITVMNVYEETKSRGKVCTHHIHIVKTGSKEWDEHINFRDYMNAHDSAAREYEALKIDLAKQYPTDPNREKYSAGKRDFIEQALINVVNWKKRHHS